MHKRLALLLCLLVTHLQAHFIEPKKLLKSMTLEEKAAQLIFIPVISHEGKNKEFMEMWIKWADYDLGQAYAKDLITHDGIGGIVFYGHKSSAADQEKITHELQALSKIPLLVTLDAETGLHGQLDDKSVIRFPHAMTLGAIKDTQLIYKTGLELGHQLKRLGVHWAFSPVADVNSNPLNPVIGGRSFGSRPEHVAQQAVAFMKGLQEAGIMACAKHFPGHGDTKDDSHELLPKIVHDRAHFESVELYPFKKLIQAGVASVMTAHLEVPAFESTAGVPSSLSYAIVTRLLQQELGFKGLVVTDCLCMKGVTAYSNPEEVGIRALEAGNHVILCPQKPRAALRGIVNAVKTGRLLEKKLDAFVLKVLEAKARAFNQKPAFDQSLESVVHTSPSAMALKKTLYTKAVTLAKSAKPQPFANQTEKKIVLITGEKKTIFEAGIERAGFLSYKISAQLDAAGIEKLMQSVKDHEHIIIGVHDMSRKAADTYGVSKNCFEVIKRLKTLKKKVTVVIFGSPYSITLFSNVDNIVVAYEEEPEAQQAAAAIVCGTQKPEGRLPIDL